MQLRTDPKYDEALRKIALEKGYEERGKGSVTKLVESIASGELPLGERQYLDDAPWFPVLQEKISKKQPFTINYSDAEGVLRSFNATYGELVWREKRLYLEIFDPAENQDYQASALPELVHNRCFRVDRIVKDAGILDLNLPWREEGLQTIEVVFDLFGGLAYSYSKKPGDREEWIESDPIRGDGLDPARLRITRKITSDFWFLRSVAPYRDQCEIISPTALRERAIEQTKKLVKRYGMCL